MTTPLTNDSAFKAASFALDGLAIRQKATANNIANIDTPNYKAQMVTFEDQLQTALSNTDTDTGTIRLATTHTRHIATGGDFTPNGITVSRNTNTLRNDGNNVDIDAEMSSLAETTLRYQSLIQLSGMKITMLKNIIRGGR